MRRLFSVFVLAIIGISLVAFTAPISTVKGRTINPDGGIHSSEAPINTADSITYARANWNPHADLNEDGVVELMDFWIIGQHFGESW